MEPMDNQDLLRGTGRAAAIVEVFAVFALVHVCYRGIKHFTVIGQWEGAAGTNFTPGIMMVVFTAAVLWLCRRDFQAYGLTFERWQDNLSLGLTCTLVTVACAALGLAVSGFKLDSSRPPDPYERPPWAQLTIVFVFLVAGWIMALAMASDRRRIFRGIPAVLSIASIGLLAAVPSVLAASMQRSLPWPTVLWLFFGAGFGEEIFYRGYIQSRVDQAWGRPCRLLGFEFGIGLLVSSLLFGLVHALNTVDYFGGRFDFNWRMGVQSIFDGAFYGLLRARSGSVLPGAIVHGLSDVLARIPNVVRS
jgi:uncharacterized protein